MKTNGHAATAALSPDGKTITVTVPMTLKRRGGRKLIIAPEGAAVPTAARETAPWAPPAGTRESAP